MGAVHSLLDANSSGCSSVRPHHCHACGMIYDGLLNPPAKVRNHFPAELCGIWLGKPDGDRFSDWHKKTAYESQYSFQSPPHGYISTEAGQHGGNPSTTLPKRSVPNKSSLVVSTLLKHTDFTKNERSALKHGFFSSMELNNPGASDYAQLEGCHIHGCLFVEHGNLVFQALENSHQLPFLLTARWQTEGSTSVHQSPDPLPDHRCRGSDPFVTTNTVVLGECAHFNSCACRSSSLPFSFCQKTRRKLVNYLRDFQKAQAQHRVRPCYCKNCHENLLSKFLGLSPKPKDRNTDESKSHYGNQTKSEPKQSRLPPPPLRLSWPLFTLRRFGFYGSSLFKLEAGRRAPRGEGHYLFRIKALREFRQYFEHYVHRRKSLSPSSVPPHLSTQRDTPVVPQSQLLHPKFVREPREPESLLSPPGERPFRDNSRVSCITTCSLAPVTISDLPRRYSQEKTHSSEVKKKANSLSATCNGHQKLSPSCAQWVHQQQVLLPISTTPVSLQNSCPQLSSFSFSPHSSVLRRTVVEEYDTDEEISQLPEPPPLPKQEPIGCNAEKVDRKVYDNMCPGRAYLQHPSSSYTNTSEIAAPCDWLNFFQASSRGRLYTSRRAMTTLACMGQNLCPYSLEEDDPTPEAQDSGWGRVTRTRVCHTANCVKSSPKRSPTVHRQNEKTRTSSSSQWRHTSLPCPGSLDTIFAPDCVRSELYANTSTITEPSVSPRAQSSHTVECLQSPYYNLPQPEAINPPKPKVFLTKSQSACTAQSVPQKQIGPDGKQSSPTTSWAKPKRANTDVARHSNDHCYEPVKEVFNFNFLTGQVNTTEQSFPPTGPLESQSETSNPTVQLHYATLDFNPPDGEITQSFSDLNPSAGCTESDTTDILRPPPTVHNESSSSANNPSRIYGTFVNDAQFVAGGANADEQRNLTTVVQSAEVDDTALPANYVAICQLQTLAMRAVLNATT
ncbi:unnamed protein product [Calicophoron daubneyi]|uniref:IRS-type PTB domain-containing protein n=1 Tax=Calicophoron daubneyi TaxID=300641 RepID=A0AAV2TXK5_CALDB